MHCRNGFGQRMNMALIIRRKSGVYHYFLQQMFLLIRPCCRICHTRFKLFWIECFNIELSFYRLNHLPYKQFSIMFSVFLQILNFRRFLSCTITPQITFKIFRIFGYSRKLSYIFSCT